MDQIKPSGKAPSSSDEAMTSREAGRSHVSMASDPCTSNEGSGSGNSDMHAFDDRVDGYAAQSQDVLGTNTAAQYLAFGVGTSGRGTKAVPGEHAPLPGMQSGRLSSVELAVLAVATYSSKCTCQFAQVDLVATPEASDGTLEASSGHFTRASAPRRSSTRQNTSPPTEGMRQ